MTTNPYLTEIDARYGHVDLGPDTLATLAVAHEISEANRLTEQLNAPTRVVVNPTSADDIKRELARRDKLMAIPDDSGDARIAAAARRWAEAYAHRNSATRGSTARAHLAASELFEAVRQEDER